MGIPIVDVMVAECEDLQKCVETRAGCLVQRCVVCGVPGRYAV
jgi:hypothetical protein